MSLTIIVPVYNEADCLCELVNEINKFLSCSRVESSVLFVNDGSIDNSQTIIESICQADHRYHFIKFHKNRGLSAALKAGFHHSNSLLIGYIDADLQTSPMDFIKLLEFVPEYDLVTGIRLKRKDRIVKRISSKIANSVRNWMINDGIDDTGCPLKIIKAEYAKTIPFFNGMHRFIPALVQLHGGRVKQLPVEHFPRFAGQPKFNLGNRLIGPFVDAIAFRWMKKRYIRYEIEKQA